MSDEHEAAPRSTREAVKELPALMMDGRCLTHPVGKVASLASFHHGFADGTFFILSE